MFFSRYKLAIMIGLILGDKFALLLYKIPGYSGIIEQYLVLHLCKINHNKHRPFFIYLPCSPKYNQAVIHPSVTECKLYMWGPHSCSRPFMSHKRVLRALVPAERIFPVQALWRQPKDCLLGTPLLVLGAQEVCWGWNCGSQHYYPHDSFPGLNCAGGSIADQDWEATLASSRSPWAVSSVLCL